MKLCSRLAALALAFGLAQAPAHAVVNYFTGANTSTIPGLTGFQTNGDEMDGLAVTATFSTAGIQPTLLWADTGPGAGGVTGAGWSLSLSGDTFTAPWNFTINPQANLGQLRSLVLDARDALTVFDRTLPNPGTPDSAQGADFTCLDAGSTPCTNPNIVAALYDHMVNISGSGAVGDLWQTLTLTFFSAVDVPGGPRENWSFGQDTDNDSRFTAPEPGSLALLGLALGAVGWLSRRRSGR